MKYNKIEKDIKKRILTATIGAIARFENHFGYLWGQDSDNPTPEQLQNEIIWEKARTEILDYGNDQIRAAISDLRSNGNIDKVKYSYYYKIKGEMIHEN